MLPSKERNTDQSECAEKKGYRVNREVHRKAATRQLKLATVWQLKFKLTASQQFKILVRVEEPLLAVGWHGLNLNSLLNLIQMAKTLF